MTFGTTYEAASPVAASSRSFIPFRLVQTLSGSSRLFQTRSNSFRIFSDSFRFFQTLPDSIRLFQTLSEFFQTLSGSSGRNTVDHLGFPSESASVVCDPSRCCHA